MFFVLSKLLGFLITPIFWVLAAMLYGIITRNQKRKKWMFIVSFALLLIFTNPFLGNLAVSKWELAYRPLTDLHGPYYYGIVLGGMSDWDEDNNRLTFGEGNDRLMQAMDLYHRGIIRKILISSGSGSVIYTEERESIYLKDYLLRNGFPAKDLLIEPDSRNTHENAMNTAALLKPDSGVQVLITSSLHMRRADGCFKRAGVKVIDWPADQLTLPEYKAHDIGNLIVPSSIVLRNWDKLFREMVGYAAYKVMGYL